jgi:hypothetical protein
MTLHSTVIGANGYIIPSRIDDNFTAVASGIGSVASILTVTAVGGVSTLGASIVPVVGSGAVNITANPQIVAGIAGQRLTIIGTSDTNTVQFDDGTGLSLDGGNSMVLGLNSVIEFVYYNSTWIEVGRKD